MRFTLLLPFDTMAAALTHPGMLHTTADFTRIKAKINAQAEPWLTGYIKLTSNSHAQTTYAMKGPVATVIRGTAGSENYSKLYNDAAAALDTSAGTLVAIDGMSDKFLSSGLYGYQLANAADKLVRVIVWNLCNTTSALSIGTLTDNQTMYDAAVARFTTTTTGTGNINHLIWKMYLEEGSGKLLVQNKESGRDHGHATLDFALIGAYDLMAYNQGNDLFAYNSSQILAVAEYTAKYNLGFDVPYTPHVVPYTPHVVPDYNETVISANGRGTIRPEWELVYAHYSSLKGQNASWTGQMRDLVGVEEGGSNYGGNSGGYDQLGFETLMYRLEAVHDVKLQLLKNRFLIVAIRALPTSRVDRESYM
ncbi:chondroitin AC/alginate lyase [Mucidula mucida]|nr:chondroitin AC/alginate lyase [Mucidula mucida]